MEYPYNAKPMQPVHGENYDKRAAHQGNGKQLAREFVTNGQSYEKFRDAATLPARNRALQPSEQAYVRGEFDDKPEQLGTGGYRLLGEDRGDEVGDDRREVLR